MPEATAIIIGSGFGDFATGTSLATVETRFGTPSAPLRRNTVSDKEILTIARHGDAHTIPPHAINYRANLLALQASGIHSIVAVNTVGVVSDIRESGELAVPDQLLDYTWGREHTIFDGVDGRVDHIDFTTPFTAALRDGLLRAAVDSKTDCYDGGVYATTQGPRLETAAEVDRLERDGADFVGMTAMPEAAIARELGIEYACIALIVNRAAGRGDQPIHDDLDASILAATSRAKKVLRQFVANL